MIAIAAVTAQPLSLDAHVSAVADARHGAISTFMGTVRDHDPSVTGEVTHLEYTAHPDAEAVLRSIVAECIGNDVVVAVSHRTGLLAVGEVAVVVAAASAHRTQALAACAAVVERVKADLPVWKREILADGSHTWVGIT
ncbi:MAG: molybdenum cofactor biosynthesis protein MoaE [Actinobacteria bacterium HGW-Actinobacteria-4]|nr:MAG: molybdenum cofactor biosynthesis protein MoaE [Actinobacteria bacterium HGW-Actinobacteria-4]